jgi:hypothetical protein
VTSRFRSLRHCSGPTETIWRRGFTLGIGWGIRDILAADHDDLSSWKVGKFYYVLWIKWEHGIAYRRGLGRVLKEAWEREAKDEIDLVLG